jgi:hypothetical protein
METIMLVRELPFASPPSPARLFIAMVLRAGSRALERLAHRLARVERVRLRAEPLLEFHAEAGAPEGALYVNGRLVGHLDGVQRL